MISLIGDGIIQCIVAEIGFSETAFVIPTSGQHRVVRYFSPEIDPFCRHATIATGVFLGETEGDGTYILETAVERFLFPFAFGMGCVKRLLYRLSPNTSQLKRDWLMRPLPYSDGGVTTSTCRFGPPKLMQEPGT
jgi:hypothetical protein